MRIHEFAKSIDKTSKEIIQMLQERGDAPKSHSSTITDEEIAFVKNKLAPKQEAPKKEPVKQEAPKQEAPKTEPVKREAVKQEAARTEAPRREGVRPDAPRRDGVRPERKNISQVYNPQNSSQPQGKKIFTNRPMSGQPGNRVFTNDRSRQNPNGMRQGERPMNREGAPRQGERLINREGAPRQGERPMNREVRPRQGERPMNREGAPRQGERPMNREGAPRQGERPMNRESRPRQGERPMNREGAPRQTERTFNKDAKYQNNEQRGGRVRRNESRNEIPASETIMPEKNRKEREDKFRIDRQEKNRRDYEDGNGGKRGKNTSNKQMMQMQKPTRPAKPVKEEVIKVIEIPESIAIKDLAEKMKIQPAALIKELFLKGQIVTLNTEVEYEVAEEIALEHEIICEHEVKVDVIEELLKEEEEDPSLMEKRPPVVCVMGHVDHGKTSLLDAIRKTNVISGEAGGITQHIGAYTVKANGEAITFLDTPGHEAFTAMRMRGAQSTDIAVLVVAADDGVMPQTIEAINHAKAAGIAIIVAVNKIDKPSANVDKVKQELSEYELIAEDWGGDTVFVPVSAHTGEGIATLLEMILLQAEMLELKANYNRKARGIVIEAKLDKGKGPVSTVLVQKGILHVGDSVAAGSCYGKVRAMIDDKGRRIREAGPSTPVEILGLNGVPNAGEIFMATPNEKDARSIAETFISEGREKLIEGTKNKMSLDDLFTQIKAGDVKELGIVVKADVQGSVEAVRQSLVKLSNDEVAVKIIHAGVGAINESDVSLAAASNAIIIGFNVRPDNQAKEIAEKEKVDLRLYRVIYQAIADVEDAMKGLLDPVFEEKVIGHAEIRQIFKASGVGAIAGSYVLDGMFQRGCSARVFRDGEQLFEGPVASLKRFKDDVKEVKAGYECGLVFEKFNDIQEGDQVEGFIMVEVPRK